MKYLPKTLLVSAATATAATAFAAPPLDFGYSSPSRPTPGYLNEWLRTDDPYMSQWDIGINERLRYEDRSHGGFTAAGSGADFRATGVNNDNHYFLSRTLPRLGYTSKWFQLFAQGENSSVTGDRRVSVPGSSTSLGKGGSSPESNGPMDLHQGYVFLGNHKEFPVSLKLGRQEMIYGDERLIGASMWNNVGRTFDAAKMRYQNSWFGVDAFASRVVLAEDNKFDTSNPHDNFWGLYFDTAKIPKNKTEFYFLGRNASGQATTLTYASPYSVATARAIYTIGMRLKASTNDWGNFDYTVETAGQFGRFVEPSGRSEEQRAYMAFGGVYYTWKESTFTPKVGLEFNYASGDGDPSDNVHGTFENLYPTNHKFYGYADFFSLQNLIDPRAILSLKPTARTTVTAEGHLFWVADTHDSLYTVTGARRGTPALQAPAARGTGYGINPDADPYVGAEVDLIASWAISPFISFDAGFSHLFHGAYISDSFAKVPGGATDSEWIWLQTTINF